ncbi:MAG TPA: hypothetical protein VK543_07060 [Puia sp.]|nr:hypothetical protein [Puia sp.]
MKRLFMLMTAVIAITLISCTAEVVATRPADVVYERPGSPGSGYVWISGNWVWAGSGYTWREGRWDRAREGRAWHDGHWESHGNGWRWRRGHW